MEIKQNWLEVPSIRAYNYIMEIKEIEGWVSEELVELWWKFADDLDDEGQERLREELDYVEKRIVGIIEKHKTVEQSCSSFELIL